MMGWSEVKLGLRVFTNDWEWGTVVKIDDKPWNQDDPWHTVKLDSGRWAIYNQDRITTSRP
jgi:hypothetical protein